MFRLRKAGVEHSLLRLAFRSSEILEMLRVSERFPPELRSMPITSGELEEIRQTCVRYLREIDAGTLNIAFARKYADLIAGAIDHAYLGMLHGREMARRRMRS